MQKSGICPAGAVCLADDRLVGWGLGEPPAQCADCRAWLEAAEPKLLCHCTLQLLPGQLGEFPTPALVAGGWG